MVLQERRGRAHETRAARGDELDSGATSRKGIREILFHVDGEYISECIIYFFLITSCSFSVILEKKVQKQIK